MKDYHKPGYWKDWYWNKGGRNRILPTRAIRDYENYKRKLKEK